jgi:hypothetical protein
MLKLIVPILLFAFSYVASADAPTPTACPLQDISQGVGWLCEASGHRQSADFSGVQKGDSILVNRDLNGSDGDYQPNGRLFDKVLPRGDGTSWADISDSYDNCQSVLYVSCVVPKGSTLKVMGFYNQDIGDLNMPIADNASYNNAHNEYPGIALKVMKVANNEIKSDRSEALVGACPEGIILMGHGYISRDDLVTKRDLELQGNYSWSESVQEALDWINGVGKFKRGNP